MKHRILVFIAALTCPALLYSMDLSLKSPEGSLEVNIKLNNGSPYYNVNYKGKVYIEDSPLGLKTSLGDFSKDLSFAKTTNSSIDEQYKLNRAKISNVHYKANELVSSYINSDKDTLHIIFKVSNNDIAMAYRIVAGPNKTDREKKNNCIIYSENTGFKFPSYTTTFITPQAPPMTGWEKTKPSYEEEYTFDEPIGTPSKYGVGYTFPALFKIGNNGWCLVSETGVDSRYVGTRIGEGNSNGLYMIEFPQEGENNGIGATSVAAAMPLQTSWKTITIGENLKPIVETTVTFDVVKPLTEPSIEYKTGRSTWSWIVWQDGSINYDDQVKFIDLSAKLGFEYVLVDNWWDNNIGRERIVDLVKYADSKGVGVLLWYNSNGYWSDAPQTPQDCMDSSPARKKEMAWLRNIGVKGLKVDFFGGDKQETIKLYEDILTDANEYGLTITFHGCTLPRGWERMYPNFITSEAVLASENLIFNQYSSDKHAYNATILPFTRNAVGAMDFGPLFLNKVLSKDQRRGTKRRVTDAFELATAVLYQSPVQHFGLTPNNPDEQPEYVLDFIRNVPTVWDETLFIDGSPGKHCVIARRKGDVWYIAAVNGEKQQTVLNINLPMLSGKKVSLLYDKKDRTTGYSEVSINKNGNLKISMEPEGGAVIISSFKSK